MNRYLMLLAISAAGAAGPAIAQPSEPFAKLRAVPFTQVRISDRFWAPRRETNRKVSLPHSLDMLEKAGNMRDFDRAARHEHTGYEGPVFMDSDLYKTLEAVSYSLATDPNPELEKRIDGIIARVAAAQMPDGYLDTWYQVNAPDRRWTNLRDNHELYCAGHLFEAAVAHYQATGKRTLLNVATKLADHIDSVFGDGPGKRLGYPGHPEIELALVKLARVTGEQRYFNLARFFIENRGRHFFATEHGIPEDQYDGAYCQDDVPIRDHRTIKGHAVRATYLLSGVVDVAAQTGDPALLQMVDRVWRNTTQRKMYVTGGIGPSASNEGFTTDYDLPNLTAYQETCASVAMAMWNQRLALLYGDGKYADLVERSLYNGVLAGVSLDGTRFFYVNPLTSTGNHHRSEWFGCACCPPNVARTLASLGGYAYAQTDDEVRVNLYIQGSVDVKLRPAKVHLDVTTDYPWSGRIGIAVKPSAPARFALRLRIPGWCHGASVRVNGAPVKSQRVTRGYVTVERLWRSGDTVSLDLPMPAFRVEADPRVKDDVGRLAIQRGPLVYCVEQCDISSPVHALSLPAGAALRPVWRPKLLNGVMLLESEAVVSDDNPWEAALYRQAPAAKRVPFTAIPYYAWDNRKPGEMEVWLPVNPIPALAGGLEKRAAVAVSYQNSNSQPWGINDGVEPKSSCEQPQALCHWWPHKGTSEWVQYTWKKPVTVSGSRAYWFDDTGRGECRLPAEWLIEYRDGAGAWKPVHASGAWTVVLDRWCSVRFEPVTTTALRLVVKMQPGWAAGVHEWQVTTPDDEP